MMNLAANIAEATLGQWMATATMALGLVAVAWAVWRSSRARAASDRVAAMPAGERLEAIRRREEERRALEGVAADAEEIGRRLAEDLEARSERLERLIAEADRRIKRLEGMGAPPSVPRRLGTPPPPGAGEGARAGGYVEAAAGVPGPALDGVLDPLSRQIYALADQGLKPVEIAGRLEQHTGKVELILALRPR